MKKTMIVLCAAGMLTVQLAMPVSAASLQSIRTNIETKATPAVALPEKRPADEVGTISFSNLEARLRKDNASVVSIQATIDQQKKYDRALAYNNLVDSINQMVDMSWRLKETGVDTTSLDANIEAMRGQLAPLRASNYEKSLDRMVRQLENSIQQIVTSAETLYLNVLNFENSLSDLKRSLVTLDSNVKEMELRYSLGQVSQLSLTQLRTTQQSTKTQATTMEIQLANMRQSLSILLGVKEDKTGEKAVLTLDGIPNMPTTQDNPLLALTYEDALKQAKENSFNIYAAKNAMNDAQDSITSTSALQGGQSYSATKATYSSTVQNFENSFELLYLSLSDTQTVLQAAKATQAYQKQNYAAAELKFQLGQISDKQLKAVKEELLNADSAVVAAEIKYFTTYHQYERAVTCGILG